MRIQQTYHEHKRSAVLEQHIIHTTILQYIVLRIHCIYKAVPYPATLTTTLDQICSHTQMASEHTQAQSQRGHTVFFFDTNKIVSPKNAFVSALCALARTQIGHKAKKIAFVSKKNTPNLIVDTRDCQISRTQTQISRVDDQIWCVFLRHKRNFFSFVSYLCPR